MKYCISNFFYPQEKKEEKKINSSLLGIKQGSIYCSPFLPIYDNDFPVDFEITTLRNKTLQHLLC